MSDDPDVGNLVGKILAHSKTLMHSIELENGEAFTGIEDGSSTVSLEILNSPGEECSLALSGPPGAEISARIYDVTGRMVAAVFDGRLPEGGATVVWDGLDASGERTASGVYFALVEHAGVSRTAKLVHIR
jgi:hypothetical protein